MVNLDVAPGLHRGRAGASPADRAVHRAVSRRADPDRHQQHRAARRRRLADQAGHDPARRLRHQLQLRLVLDASRGSSPASRRSPTTDTAHRHAASPAARSSTVRDRDADETTNNYGVDRDYALGRVQTWNADCRRTSAGLERRRRLHRHPRREPRHRPRARTAARSACGSRACSRSSGRRRKDRRC